MLDSFIHIREFWMRIRERPISRIRRHSTSNGFKESVALGSAGCGRREVKERCGAFLEHQKCEDFDMHLRMFDVTKAMLVPKVLGTWRQRDDSLSSQCNQNQWRDSRQIVARHKWTAHANCRIANVSPYIDPAGVNYFLSYGLTETQPGFASRHILGHRTALQRIPRAS